MKYLPLIDLRLTHTYYTDGRCPDFAIQPTGATQKLLHNYRCVLKTVPNGFLIFLPVTAADTERNSRHGPFLELAEAVFSFNLHLRNPDFDLFTDRAENILTERFVVQSAAQSSNQPGEQKVTLQGRPLPFLKSTDFRVRGDTKVVRGTFSSSLRTPFEFQVADRGSEAPMKPSAATPAATTIEKHAVSKDKLVRERFTPITVSAYDEAAKTVTLATAGASNGDYFTISYPIGPRPAGNVRLFSTDEFHSNELAAGELSDKLRSLFAEQQMPLTSVAKVTERRDSAWAIEDACTEYVIRREFIPPSTKQMLGVYSTVLPDIQIHYKLDVELHDQEHRQKIYRRPLQFQVEFNAKQARWKYYLVTNLKDAQFKICDMAKNGPQLVFSDQNRTNLNQDIDPTDAIATALAAQYPDMQRWRFVSDLPVPCQEVARQQLRLILGTEPVGAVLPNPALSNYGFAATSDDQPQNAAWLFQIVKYFGPSLPKTKNTKP